MNFIVAKREELINELEMAGGCTFSQLTPMWRDDKALVRAVCLGSTLYSLKWASARLLDDEEFIEELVAGSGGGYKPIRIRFVKFLSVRLRNNARIIKLIFKRFNASILRDIGNDLIDNKALILPMINCHGGWHLERLSERLRDDKQVVLSAITNSPSSMMDVSERLRADREFMLRLAGANGYAIIWNIGHHILGDVEMMKVAMMRSYKLLPSHTTILTSDRPFIKQLLRAHPKAFRYVGAKLADDFGIAYCAIVEVGGNVGNLQFVGRKLLNDARFLLGALRAVERWGEMAIDKCGGVVSRVDNIANQWALLFKYVIDNSRITPRGYAPIDIVVCLRLAGW